MNFDKLEADKNMILNKHFTKGRGGNKVEFVGIHYNAGDLTIEGCYSVWQNREASAHYQVESSGRCGQLVWDRDTAWALGNFKANQRSINIEHANKPGGVITEACLDTGAHLVAAICKDYGLGRPEWGKNVKPHSAISPTQCPGQIYGSQKDAYIQRAQMYYDKMTGASGGQAPVKPSAPSGGYDLDAIASEVIAGKWGNGSDRKNRLLAAGYDPSAVQDRVNALMGQGGSTAPAKKNLDTVAREVIRGDWGNGQDRKNRLIAAGYDYNAVQNRVNQLMQ